MIILISIAIWLFITWHLIAKRFPNDPPQLRAWVWLIPFIPLLYYLLFLTGLVMVVVLFMIDGIIYRIKNKQ